jgi:hypothetical protein
MIVCKNCTANFEGKFCPQCGQSATVHRYTLRHILHEFFHAFTHADKSIFALIKKILIAPGYLATDLFAGKRKKYFSLFTAFLIIATIAALSDSWTHYFDYLEESHKIQERQGVFFDAYKWSTKNAKFTILIFIPITAFLTWLLFRRQRCNFAEHFIFNTIVMSGFALMTSLVFHPAFAVFKYDITVGEYVIYLFHIVYRTVANRQLFKERWVWTILKTLLMYILQIVLFWILLIAAILLVRLIGY